MASKYTANYGLSQWEPGDSFLRTEFNRDNQRLDAALAEKASGETVTALQAAVAGKADAEGVDSRFSSVNGVVAALRARVEVKVGSYTGDGAAKRTIRLGFTPKAVILEAAHGLRGNMNYGGLALQGSPCKNGSSPTVEVVSGGFQVGYVSNTVSSNASGDVYHYIALL